MPPPQVDLSKEILKTRTTGPIFHLTGCERTTGCDADVMLVMTLSSDWYGEQPVAFGCPHALPEITLLLSMTALLHSECPRTIIETLVAEEWWKIAEVAPPASREAVQFNAVMGWRFWFPMSTMTASRVSAKISAMISQNANVESRAATYASVAPPFFGMFDIKPGRAVESMSAYHKLTTFLHGCMKVDIPRQEEMTFEVPNSNDGQATTYAFTQFRPIFEEDAADDIEDDEASEVQQAPSQAQGAEARHALPQTHALYPYLASVQAQTPIEDQRHHFWKLSPEQHMSQSIKTANRYEPPEWVKTRGLLHDVSNLEPEELLTMCFPPSAPTNAAIGETLGRATAFVGAGTFDEQWLSQAQPFEELSRSMFDKMVRVPVERAALSLTVTPFDEVFSKKYSAMWTRRLANQRLVPYYLKHFSFKTFLKERLLPDKKRMEATSTTSGWPAYTNRLAVECRALDAQIQGQGEESEYAQQLDDNFEVRLQRSSWGDFSSCLVSRNANAYLRDLNLTATQAMIVEYCLAAFGRLPDLFTVAQVVVIVLLGDFGQGKSWCIETVQMLMPSGSQSTGSWITETANAHLAEDLMACFTTSDEVYSNHSDQMQNTATSSRVSGRQRLKPDPNGGWVKDLSEVLMDQARIIAGNDAPSDAIMNRAQPVFIGAQPGPRTAKQCAMAPGNESRKRGLSLSMRRHVCRLYDNWVGDNLCAYSLDNTIIRVVMAVYQAIMPEEYNSHSTRQFVAIRNLAMSAMKHRITALWHNVVKHRGDDSDEAMFQFYAHRNWVTPIDGLRALFTTLKLCDSTKMQRDVSAQLQAMVKFQANDKPVTADNNPLYYETELHPDRMAEQLMALMPVGYGKSIIRWYLGKLIEKAGHGGNAVLVVGNGTVRVLKSYVLAAECQAVKAVWHTILWIVAHKPSNFWGIDFDTEKLLVLNNSTKHLLLKPESSADFPEIPPTLNGITKQACNRALQLLAEAGHVWWMDDHKQFFYSSSDEVQKATTSFFCAEIKPADSADNVGVPVIQGGGIERMYGSDAFVKIRNRLFGAALAVKLDVLEVKRDHDPSGASQTAERQKVIEQVCMICGGVAPGRYAWGLSNSSPTQFNESTVRGFDHGIIKIDNPNQDLDASGSLKQPLNTRGSPLERVFPPAYSTLEMGSHWKVSELVQEQISMTNTGTKCPFKWSIWVTDNKCVEVFVEYNNSSQKIYVPKIGKFLLKDVLRQQMDCLPATFDIVGRKHSRSAHITIQDIRAEKVDDNEITIIAQTNSGQAAKRLKRA